MIHALKSEFRKLLTIRSTYVITLVVLGFAVLIAFYALGYRAKAEAALNPDALSSSAKAVAQFIGLIIGLVSILLVSHEYRYNLIMYTLTAARWRWQTLGAKFVVVTVYVAAVAALICLLSPLLTKYGMSLHHITLVTQNLPLPVLLANCVFYSWGCAMFGGIIALIVRSQVGAIAIYLLFPSIIENIMVLFLKGNSKYLPFTALSEVVHNGPSLSGSVLTHTQAILLTLVYVVVGWIVAYILFAKRDAN